MALRAAGPIWRALCILLVCALTLAAAAPAAPPLEPIPFPDELSEETQEIASSMWSPYFPPGEFTVAESPTEPDRGIRLVIEEKVTAGESQRAIFQYFVNRYGERILVSPPQNALSYAFLATATAAAAALLWLMTRRRRSA